MIKNIITTITISLVQALLLPVMVLVGVELRALLHATLAFLRDGRGHVFYFEAYGFQLVDSVSADRRRALQAS